MYRLYVIDVSKIKYTGAKRQLISIRSGNYPHVRLILSELSAFDSNILKFSVWIDAASMFCEQWQSVCVHQCWRDTIVWMVVYVQWSRTGVPVHVYLLGTSVYCICNTEPVWWLSRETVRHALTDGPLCLRTDCPLYLRKDWPLYLRTTHILTPVSEDSPHTDPCIWGQPTYWPLYPRTAHILTPVYEDRPHTDPCIRRQINGWPPLNTLVPEDDPVTANRGWWFQDPGG